MLPFKGFLFVLLKNSFHNLRFFQLQFCFISKAIKDTAIIAMIPQLRETLSQLMYKIQAAVVGNDCSSIFWAGNLKNKDLHGDEILSQVCTIFKYVSNSSGKISVYKSSLTLPFYRQRQLRGAHWVVTRCAVTSVWERLKEHQVGHQRNAKVLPKSQNRKSENYDRSKRMMKMIRREMNRRIHHAVAASKFP